MFKMLINLIISQFKVFLREPGVLFWVFGFPILMAWILGVAFSSEQEILKKIAVLDQNSSSQFYSWIKNTATKEISPDFETPVYKIKLGENRGDQSTFWFVFTSESDAVKLLRKGKISLLLEEKSNLNSLVYHFDPNHADSKLTYLLLKNALLKSPLSTMKTDIKILSSIGNRYIDFLIPGLIAIGIMNSCIWGVGWTLIEMRMKKLLRRMIATPLKKPIFLLSHFANRLIITNFEIWILFFFAKLYFDIKIEGSILGLFLIIICGNIAFAGIAILLACRARNTIVANGLINLTTLPMLIVSGVFFSYHNFPDWSLLVIKKLPLTILVDSIRGIIIEGSNFNDLIIPSISLFIFGLVGATIGLKFFKWH